MTAGSRICSRKCSTRNSSDRFDKHDLYYQHRLIDDMVASCMKWEGEYVWACKNYDGDVQSDTVAQGFGSLGLMTSVLLTPDGDSSRRRRRTAPSRATTASTSKGRATSTNPIASIFAWSQRLKYRGKFDDTPDVEQFARALEEVCVDTVEAGQMTKDLAILIGPEQDWMTTQEFLATLDENLRKALA